MSVFGSFPFLLKRRNAQGVDAGSRQPPSEMPEDLLPAVPVELAEGDAGEASASVADQMLAEHRSALLLRPQLVVHLTDLQYQQAWEAFDEAMVVVPAGQVAVHGRPHEDEPPPSTILFVEALYLDRFAVSNQQFQRFVDAGCYEQAALWHPEILTGITDFVDQTGQPGPRFWQQGRFPKGRQNYPVTGICWYEAEAYARWVGKRLPTDAEWVKAASWPVSEQDHPVQRRYPWGNSMDHRRANLWASGMKDTVPVDQHENGVSVGGAYQLIGNVWEWTSSSFGCWDRPQRIDMSEPVMSLRGAAFDTYFDRQASCQFQSGDSPLARKHNIGFRCAISMCDISPPPDDLPAEVVDELDPDEVQDRSHDA